VQEKNIKKTAKKTKNENMFGWLEVWDMQAR
jgi:hypothetical protein